MPFSASILTTFIDVDECRRDMHNCSASEHKVCMDTIGSYICKCTQGYDNSSDLCNGTRLVRYYDMCVI